MPGAPAATIAHNGEQHARFTCVCMNRLPIYSRLLLPCTAPMLGGRSGRYMEKLAVGPRVNPHMVSLLYPIERNLRAVAAALEKPLGCAQPAPGAVLVLSIMGLCYT